MSEDVCNFIDVLGYRVYNGLLDEIEGTNGTIVINTISPNSYGMATKDYVFQKALKSSDYLVLDGVYFALASILCDGKSIKKNQVPEMFYHFMKKMQSENGKVFFLGSTKGTLSRIKNRTKIDYPALKVQTYSPPYKEKFDDQDNALMIDKINEFNPDLLCIGMTAPKQEKWVFVNKNKIKVKYIISIEAVFDWYAGNRKEVLPIWWKFNLGWLGRVIQRPEIIKRNFPNVCIFLKI
ncbi:WecB/TagA/CpsF family glycosyltransferase [Prosthecochloris sp. SCSIO W1101]|uniref:WecB/TagA/CpsF family glycosyltransferase n=1 Tax=Prosthecochloris sp. SCSIO W1101 TaxID=2992242 RepID=UPI00223DC839|nr:WecB/TagA/CpsF family glycosyltransferase [Prosthecochloris sp. SCSIO W1101]UZJ41987.1 WecB/TagA/CpsF family glycosyltransferase [Prosthecochloris sp. SCSIO W1101]